MSGAWRAGRLRPWGWSFPWCLATILAGRPEARAQTPVTGHYPPGQSGIRGAAAPAAGVGYTNFNRFFSNLEARDGAGAVTRELDEVRYANISMITWTSGLTVFGMTWGAMAGIPFGTGNLRPSPEETESTALGLGDVLLTPVALHGSSTAIDHTVQFTVWTPSGRFSPGAPDNRGTGFWALVYSLGAVWYPGGDRKAWSLSALARFEQNFEQEGTGVDPGDDVVIDWGVGRVVRAARPLIDLGMSGFAALQLGSQAGGPPEVDDSRYRYFGIGPEGTIATGDRLSFVLRAHWEFGARNAVQGNNLWMLLRYRL